MKPGVGLKLYARFSKLAYNHHHGLGLYAELLEQVIHAEAASESAAVGKVGLEAQGRRSATAMAASRLASGATVSSAFRMSRVW